MARFKRIIPLLLALALVVPVLLIAAPVTVRADETIVDYNCVSIDECPYSQDYSVFYNTFSSNNTNLQSYYSVLENLPHGCVMIISYLGQLCYGLYVADNGLIMLGAYYTDVFSFDSSIMGVHSLNDFVLYTAYPVYSESDLLFFIDKESAVSYAVENGVNTTYLISWSNVYTFKLGKIDYSSGTLSSTTSYYYHLFKISSVISKPYYPSSSAFSSDYLDSTVSIMVSGASTPTLETSFGGQVIYISKDETANFFILADNVNGTATADWYCRRVTYADDGETVADLGEWEYWKTFELYSTDEGFHIGAAKYTPDADAAPYCIMLKAVVTNTVGDSTASVETDFVILHVTAYNDSGGGGSGSTDATEATDPIESPGDSGSDSGTSGDLTEIKTSLDEVKDAVASVDDKLDGVSDQLDGVSDQLDGVSDQLEESNSWLSNIADGITSLPEKIMDGIKGLFVPDEEAIAEQQNKWNQLLADRFGVVYESVEIVDNLAGAFTNDGTTDVIEFPTVTVPLGEIDWTLGGWEVDVVPDGFEFLIEVLKKIIDILCTLAFVNAMKNKYERVLDDRGG